MRAAHTSRLGCASVTYIARLPGKTRPFVGYIHAETFFQSRA
jgi:hypothetical protein